MRLFLYKFHNKFAVWFVKYIGRLLLDEYTAGSFGIFPSHFFGGDGLCEADEPC